MSDQNPSIVSPRPQLPAPPADAQNPSAKPAAIPAPVPSAQPPALVPAPATPPEPIDHTSRDQEMVLNAPGGLGELITGDNIPNLIQELPSRLYLAFLYIQRGYPVRKIAESMKVSRGTIYHWINNDPRLIAALRKWRALNYIDTDARMAALLAPSLDGLETAVAHGSVPAMLAVIKHNGKRRIGATDEKVISARLARRKKRRAEEINPPAAAGEGEDADPVAYDDPATYPWHASPPDDSASHLVNVSTVETLLGQAWKIARLHVENTSDKTIIARLRWENGGGAPFYTPKIVLFANRTNWTGQTIYVTLGSTLTMTVEESHYK